MQRDHHCRAWTASAVICAGILLGGLPSTVADEPLIEATAYYDYVDDTGRLTGGRMQLWVADPQSITTRTRSDVVTVVDNGPPDNRIDLVFVGDGYTADDLDDYADHVDALVAALFAQEPFATYRDFFNVHRVDVISNDTGVDHDPSYPIWRDTALNMGYWCGGTERALCVDLGLALAEANNAPGVDSTVAVANSSKYGGVGYPTMDVATVAGANSAAGEIILHELGHSLGNLADEYDYEGPSEYIGPEPGEANVSIKPHDQMLAEGVKWAPWLDVDESAFDGYHSTYEGAYYSLTGIYRPTNNSKMRSLGRPFNHPGVQALIVQMHRIVNPIDDSTPIGQVLSPTDTVWIDLVEPFGQPLDVTWTVDTAVIPGETRPTLDLSQFEFGPGVHWVSVNVVDNTVWVRNDTARWRWMTEQRNWTIQVDPCGWLGDCDADCAVTAGDVPAFLACVGGTEQAVDAGCSCGRFDADTDVDLADVAAMQRIFGL